MNYESIIKQAAETIEEIEQLKKSYDKKVSEAEPKAEEMEKAEEEPASDEQSDAVHQADEHSEDEGSVEEYVKQLSDDELYELMSALSEEAEGRGVGEDTDSEEPAVSEEAPQELESPEMEKGQEGSLEEKVSGLSEDELEMLMQAVMQEKQTRGEDAEPEMEKMAAPPMAPSHMMKSFMTESERNMKDLTKSIEGISKNLEKLSGKVAELELNKSQADKEEDYSIQPAGTYSDSKVKVLEKSSSPDEENFLLGRDMQDWLLEQQKAGAPKVNSDLVGKAGLIKSVEAAAGFYGELETLGIKPPKKKA